MKAEGVQEVRADINVTPLVDVVLVLLIIFMVVMPVMVTQGIQLPNGPHGTPHPEDRMKSISMTAAGLLFYEQEPVTEEALSQRLHDLHARNPEAQVVLRADKRILYGDVHHVLDLAAGAGIQNLALLADPGSSQRQNPKP